MPKRIMRKPAVLKAAGVSDPTLWRWERLGLFPKRIKLGTHCVGWIESEIIEWQQKKSDERN